MLNIFCVKNGDELAPGVNEMIKSLYCSKKKKFLKAIRWPGRHGNKGSYFDYSSRRHAFPPYQMEYLL